MFAQIRYALLDIKTSKRICILFFLQMVVVFLLVNSSFISIIRVNDGIHRLEKLKNKNAYINKDSTSNNKIDALIADEKNSVQKAKELYKFIIDNDRIEKYSIYQYASLESINGHAMMQTTVNKTFFDIYDVKVIEGRMFNDNDFLSNSKLIPLVVGYNLKDRYKLGQTYNEVDNITRKQVTYKVIGILEYNSSYPVITDIGREISLNYSYIAPLNLNTINDFGSIDMAIGSTVVFTNDQNEARAIEKKSSELKLFSIHYTMIQECINDFLWYFERKMIYQIFLAIIILAFASTSMALNLSTMVSKKTKEFSIHIICGGGINSIMQRLLWQLLIILSTALIPTILVYKINTSLLYTILLACFVTLSIMIIPYVKIRRFTIAQLVRRSE